MFARKLALVAVLLVATPAFGAFRSDLYMTGTDDGAALPNGGSVEEGSVMVLTVMDDQTWNHTPPNSLNRMTWIQINFDASSADLLDDLAAGTWAWDMFLGITMTTEVDDSMVWSIYGLPEPDLMVKRTGPATWPPMGMDAPQHNLGALTFTAPPYNPGGNNTYTVSLAGGEYDDTPGQEIDTITQLIGQNQGESAGRAWGTMSVEDFTFTVTPEPATLALMVLGGGVALLIRRKR